MRNRLAAAVVALTLAGAADARTILFVGNSFTFGANSPVQTFHPDRVTDLNHEGIGGVPALFKTFATESGLDWQVSLETSPGKSLAFHYETKRDTLAGRWDVVILQGYSTLDAARPGNPETHVCAAGQLAAMFKAANPNATVDLVTTWSRADLTYRPGSPWSGKPITAMVGDLAAANAMAVREFRTINAAIPVGQSWIRAFDAGVADPDPYDGTDFGKVDLWSWDYYHASAAGYYLEALVVFASVTGVDPRSLGVKESAAREIGLSPAVAKALQGIAFDEVAATKLRK
ncbi:PEP-CTERM sorting domain-containing protein [Glacieibacterium sp.]|uniref:PEP-CTERM sorting domain-containing protein n=1 Tax=Glacieibacterium sp. TaxID=2860237 RepID=UPI003B00546D